MFDTCTLASLGWDSTPVGVAMERTVGDSLRRDRAGSEHDPGRVAEERLIEAVT